MNIDTLIKIGKDIENLKRLVFTNNIINNAFKIDKYNLHCIHENMLIDIFPVAINDFLEFIMSKKYFNKAYWPKSREIDLNADAIVKRILGPINYCLDFDDMNKKNNPLEYIPVTNVYFDEACAYAKSRGMQLMDNENWKIAAKGTNNLKSRLKKEMMKTGIDENIVKKFSDIGAWGMLGNLYEWAIDDKGKKITKGSLLGNKGDIDWFDDETNIDLPSEVCFRCMKIIKK
jgi:hypothetical protein